MENGSDSTNPRYGNTGVERTTENPLRACLDWVEGTLKIENFRLIFELFNVPESEWEMCEKGLMRYRRQMRYGKIVVLWDGIDDNMGVHFVMSGAACRQFESYYHFGWHRFLNDIVVKYSGQFSRIDAAIDDFKGYFTVRAMVCRVKRGEVSSRFKMAKNEESIRIEDGSTMGQTIYFGSKKSDLQVRIYDKLEERKAKGIEIEEGLEVWVRTELQMRNARAQAFAFCVIRSYSNGQKELENNVGHIVAGVLKNSIIVRTRNKGDSNKRRWPVCEWWDEYLGEVGKISLADKAPDRTIEQTKKWFENQIPRTFAKIYLAMSQDDEYIKKLILKGYGKLSESDINQIDSYLKRFKEEGSEDDDAG